MVTVTLTWPEQLQAVIIGGMRRIGSKARCRTAPYGDPQANLWDIDIEAAGAELAVAKAMGVYWTGICGYPEPAGDVGGLEVRSTKRMDGRLILHDRDKDDAPYILVRGAMPIYQIVGWIYGRDGKQERYLFHGDGRSAHRRAYFVPVEALRGMDELIVHRGVQASTGCDFAR